MGDDLRMYFSKKGMWVCVVSSGINFDLKGSWPIANVV